MNREWALVCEGESFALCLAGWESPGGAERGDAKRTFEAIWSVEPDVVRDASRICAEIAAAQDAALDEPFATVLETPLSLALETQLQLATAVSARMLTHLSSWLIRSER